MVTIETEITCVRVIHRLPDDFTRVLYFQKEDGSEYDLSEITLKWDFFRDCTLLFSISGSDISIDGNAVTITKAGSFLSELPMIGNYTHRFYDSDSNKTFFHGPLLLEGAACYAV